MKTIHYLIIALFLTEIVFAQSIVIGTGSVLDIGTGSDVCAGVYGNIQGTVTGNGTQCGQSLQQTFQLTVAVSNGWNMVSVPGLHPINQNVDTWWAFRDLSANVFKYATGYQTVTDVTPGIGYWMKHAGNRTYNTGDEWPAGGIQIVTHDPVTAAAGWNMIGGYELSVTASLVTTNPPGLQSGPIYKYSSGYSVATTLDPGYGYWIKLTGAGQIIIPESLSKEDKQKEFFPDSWGKILLTDAEGRHYTLYAIKEDSPDKGNRVDLAQYELPPSPPSGMFDIRYGSGRIAEDINSSTKTIDMSGVTYPLTVRVENIDLRFQDETGKNINSVLKSGESMEITNPLVNKLNVTKDILPKEYALEQNYPNPFNPTTTIQFSVPKQTQLKINIYNTLGELVATIADGMYQAGYYKIMFDASKLSSGTYIYRLESSDFVEVKKMILIK